MNRKIYQHASGHGYTVITDDLVCFCDDGGVGISIERRDIEGVERYEPDGVVIKWGSLSIPISLQSETEARQIMNHLRFRRHGTRPVAGIKRERNKVPSPFDYLR